MSFLLVMAAWLSERFAASLGSRLSRLPFALPTTSIVCSIVSLNLRCPFVQSALLFQLFVAAVECFRIGRHRASTSSSLAVSVFLPQRSLPLKATRGNFNLEILRHLKRSREEQRAPSANLFKKSARKPSAKHIIRRCFLSVSSRRQ